MTFDNSFESEINEGCRSIFLCLAVFFAAFSFLMSQPAVAMMPCQDTMPTIIKRSGFLSYPLTGVKNGEKINPEYSPMTQKHGPA